MFNFMLLAENAENWTETAISVFAKFYGILAVTVCAIVLIIGFITYKVNRQKFDDFKKIAISILIGCALTIAFTMFTLNMYDMLLNEYLFSLVFWPVFALICVFFASIVSLYVASLFSEKVKKITSIVCYSVCAIALIVTLIMLGIYFYGDANNNYGEDMIKTVQNLPLYISSAILIIVIFTVCFIFDKQKTKFDTKAITYGAICVAMSFALSYIKLFPMPQGGSVTLASLLPIMIYAYIFGSKKGLMVGIVYGVLQAIQDPWLIHPAQFLLDYPIAFSCIGLVGVFKSINLFKKLPALNFALGAVCASVFRFISHLFSGVFAFSEYANGVNPWIYSLGYNSFVFVDIALVIIVGFLVFSSKAFNAQIEKLNENSLSENQINIEAK